MTGELLVSGPRFNIYGVVLAGDGIPRCPAEMFLSEISEPSRKSMLNVLRQHAVSGPILNELRSRMLRSGIFEFKSRQGDRLLWFYPPGVRGETVITHGFHKGAPVNNEIRRAERLRDVYLEEAE